VINGKAEHRLGTFRAQYGTGRAGARRSSLQL
jgi:hypothetical protein